MTDKMLVSRLFDDIDNAVCSIFIKFQNELNITNGDVSPMLMLKLDNSIECLAEVMEKILAEQKTK